MLILITLATFVSTLVGGLFALRFRDKLHLILGFSAGAVIAVAFFDLMPESLDLGREFFFAGPTIPAVIALGFFIYLILDRTVFLHGHSQDHSPDYVHREIDSVHQPEHARGILGAGSLCIHSFLDGVAIGLAFQVSAAIGVIVAVAVLVHDFSDGINTVSIIARNQEIGGGNQERNTSVFRSRAFKWLIADAVAPIIGVIVTMFFTLQGSALAVILALFCGFFLYIGASDLIPESHHQHPRALTTVMTVIGAAVLFVAIKFAGI